MWGELSKAMQSGNLYIIITLFFGFFGFVILFERFIMLQVVYNIDFTKFITNLKKMVKAEDMDRAINLCRQSSHTSLPKISLKALEAAETDPTTVRSIIEEETINFLPRIEQRLAFLPGLATLIFLIGLLGTIDGIWGAFQSIDVLDTAQKQSSAARGITASLNYTTLGILFCMVFLTGHQLLRGVAIRLTEKIHYGVAVLNNLLVPAEVMPYVPLAEGIAPSQSMETAAASEPAQSRAIDAAAQGGKPADDFDDASVEDIKDEEEII